MFQGMFGSLPSHVGLLSDATKLSGEAKDLRTAAGDLAGDVEFKLEDARSLEADAEQVTCPRGGELRAEAQRVTV